MAFGSLPYFILAFIAAAQLFFCWKKKEGAGGVAAAAIALLAVSALFLFFDQRHANSFAGASFFFFAATLAGSFFLKGKPGNDFAHALFLAAALMVAYSAGLPPSPREAIEEAVNTKDAAACDALGERLAPECRHEMALRYERPELCHGIKQLDLRDVCLYDSAVALNNEEICSGITYPSLEEQCLAKTGNS